jgi:hypothetical protein
MNKAVFGPVFVLAGLVGTMVIMARTQIFTPLIRFIHQDTISPVEAVLCIVFTGLGFACCYALLNLTCNYFVPLIGKKKNQGMSHQDISSHTCHKDNSVSY